ncbi:hypothetical protein D9M72_638050 [compost metagenome]
MEMAPRRPNIGCSAKSTPRKIGDQAASSGALTAEVVRKLRNSARSRSDWVARVSP